MKRADVVSVRSLLSGNARYSPAPGHRGFVWSPAEVAQLLVDLEVGARQDEAEDDEFAPDERFYLGVITIAPMRNGLFSLIDGQQRLATLALMLAFARDRIEDSAERQRIDRMLVRRSFGRPPEPRIRLTPEDHAWYSHFILPPGATKRLPEQAPLGSPRELLMAARFLEHAFESYDQDDLWRLAGFASFHAAVVRTVVDARTGFVPQIAAPQQAPYAGYQHHNPFSQPAPQPAPQPAMPQNTFAPKPDFDPHAMPHAPPPQPPAPTPGGSHYGVAAE